MSTRIEGIVDRLTDAETFDSISWILGSGVVTNYAESIIDDHLKANCEFQSKAGLSVTVERVMTGKDPCNYCKARQGKYTYPNVPDELWGRHVKCHCYITYDNGSVRQVLGGTDKKWEVISEEVLDGRKKVGMTTTTQRELNARKIVGMKQATAEQIEQRAAIGTGKVGTAEPAQLKKAGKGTVKYMGNEEQAHYFTRQQNAAQAIVDKFGGDIKYLESVSDPSKLNWNGETWRIVQGQDFSGAIKYWNERGGADGLVFDATGFGNQDLSVKTIKKRLESAINSAGVTKDIDIIVVRDGKVISTLEFKMPEVLKQRRTVFPRRATPALLEERKMVGAEPTQVKPQDAQKAVLDFEKKSRSLANERAIMVDPDGKVYAQSQGRTRSVSIKDAPKEGYTLSHNHPAPVTFSVADVKQFETNGFKQIRAVTTEKTYILEAIDPKKLAGEDRDFTGAMSDYWAKLDEESAKKRKQLNEEAMRIEDRVERSAFLRKRMQGILDWRNKAESEWLYKNAKKYGYIYWEEPVKL